MTEKECRFHITVPAERLGLLNRRCNRPAVRNIVDEGYLIAADFCEIHYQVMLDWLDDKDSMMKKKEV